MNEIILTKEECNLVISVGSRRELNNILGGNNFDKSPPPNNNRDGFKQHIYGAFAECAVAKFFGQYWSGVVDNPWSSRTDVGIDIEVRWANDGYAIKKRDKPNCRMVFVGGEIPNFIIKGWVNTSDVIHLAQNELGYSYIQQQFIRDISEFEAA